MTPRRPVPVLHHAPNLDRVDTAMCGRQLVNAKLGPGQCTAFCDGCKAEIERRRESERRPWP